MKCHLLRLVVLNKAAVQQSGFETLQNNRSSLKQKQTLRRSPDAHQHKAAGVKIEAKKMRNQMVATALSFGDHSVIGDGISALESYG